MVDATAEEHSSKRTTCEGGYDKPAWQNMAGAPDDAKCDISDISLFSADGLTGSFYLYCMSSSTPNKTCNYDDSDNLAHMGAGGTSFATPVMAGVIALVNHKTNDRQGNGKGNFAASAVYTGGINQPFIGDAIAVDIDGDGHLDLAVLDQDNSTVNILLNNGDGTFGEPQEFFPTLLMPSEIYTADMNGDGMPDCRRPANCSPTVRQSCFSADAKLPPRSATWRRWARPINCNRA
jgi:hypothetical protein